MTSLDLRQAFNALSDVVVNRPSALREFDQIYMKVSDMLLQAELMSRWFEKQISDFYRRWRCYRSHPSPLTG